MIARERERKGGDIKCRVTVPYLFCTELYRGKDGSEILLYLGITGRYCHDIVMEQDGARHERCDIVGEDIVEWCI